MLGDVMARVVGVHGIAQEFKGPAVLAETWGPARRDGVALSGATAPDPSDIAIAFYGDMFRRPGSKALGAPQYVPDDLQDESERDLLGVWWEEAARTDQAVPGPEERTK